jgi:hypothetical protein
MSFSFVSVIDSVLTITETQKLEVPKTEAKKKREGKEF